MAKRPVFVPSAAGKRFVNAVPVEFTWHPGLSLSQKQRSIASLHDAAKSQRGLQEVLEISSKCEHESGRLLSAFSLQLTRADGQRGSVEAFFQGSKVFERGGPYTDLYVAASKSAKTDARLRSSGALIGFSFENQDWPLEPKTAFYDWLYFRALGENPRLAEHILQFDGFTDIEFNPTKSINCQAYSAALYVSLSSRGLLNKATQSPEDFLAIVSQNTTDNGSSQQSLF